MMPQLRTEQGMAGSSFWADRFRLAGQYGWTGLILPPDVDTSHPVPMDEVSYFLVETPQDKERLHQWLVEGISFSEKNNASTNNSSTTATATTTSTKQPSPTTLTEEMWQTSIQAKLMTVDDLLNYLQQQQQQ